MALEPGTRVQWEHNRLLRGTVTEQPPDLKSTEIEVAWDDHKTISVPAYELEVLDNE